MPSVIQFPEDLLSNPDYAGNYMLFSAKNISGGVDTRSLKFSDAFWIPSTLSSSTYSSRA